MKVILNGKHSEESSVLALGMFDGVHIGHQVLLERARTLHMRWGAPVGGRHMARPPPAAHGPRKGPPAADHAGGTDLSDLSCRGGRFLCYAL